MVRFCSATPGRSPPPRRYIITPPFTLLRANSKSRDEYVDEVYYGVLRDEWERLG